MSTINPYLNFDGNTEEAFNFYKSVFGGEFLALQRFKDFPEGDKLSASDREKIMHISLRISNGYILMGTDTLESMGQFTTQGNNFYISIQVESKAEADRVFKELSSEGKIEMPIQDTFWGAYFGMFADKFGIQWMVNFDYPNEK
jgi:PhnB protein